MAGKTDEYRARLKELGDWEPYLRAHSGLPGPRANLELLQAVGDEAPEDRLWRWSDETDEYLSACGTAGLGRFALTDRKVLPRLKHLAADPRWRTREAVAIALQRVGKQDMQRLLKEMDGWAAGRPYVQRAAAAGLCEPPLLKDGRVADQVLQVLDRITRSFAVRRDRKEEEVRVLRQALGYCWSVAAAAAPAAGRSAMEAWLGSKDPDVRWILRSNLAKSRMKALGEAWLSRAGRMVEQ